MRRLSACALLNSKPRRLKLVSRLSGALSGKNRHAKALCIDGGLGRKADRLAPKNAGGGPGAGTGIQNVVVTGLRPWKFDFTQKRFGKTMRDEKRQALWRHPPRGSSRKGETSASRFDGAGPMWRALRRRRGDSPFLKGRRARAVQRRRSRAFQEACARSHRIRAPRPAPVMRSGKPMGMSTAMTEGAAGWFRTSSKQLARKARSSKGGTTCLRTQIQPPRHPSTPATVTVTVLPLQLAK